MAMYDQVAANKRLFAEELAGGAAGEVHGAAGEVGGQKYLRIDGRNECRDDLGSVPEI